MILHLLIFLHSTFSLFRTPGLKLCSCPSAIFGISTEILRFIYNFSPEYQPCNAYFHSPPPFALNGRAPHFCILFPTHIEGFASLNNLFKIEFPQLLIVFYFSRLLVLEAHNFSVQITQAFFEDYSFTFGLSLLNAVFSLQIVWLFKILLPHCIQRSLVDFQEHSFLEEVFHF